MTWARPDKQSRIKLDHLSLNDDVDAVPQRHRVAHDYERAAFSARLARLLCANRERVEQAYAGDKREECPPVHH